MPGSYATFREDALLPPTSGPNGQAFARAFGGEQDAEKALLIAAARQDIPSRCPDDGTPLLSGWYGGIVEVYPSDTPDTIRAKCAGAWDAAELAGSKEAMIASLRAQGFADIAIFNDFEGTFAGGAWFSRFWIVLGPDFGTTGIAPLVAPFTTGPTTTGGSTATPHQVDAVVRTVLKWKWAGAYPVKVILRFGAVCLGGINTVAPFTPPVNPYADTAWDVGPLAGDRRSRAPLIPGQFFRYA